MKAHLGDLIRYQSDRLFYGAVNVEWFQTDYQKREAAASSFVFHGPEYHGVTQAEIGSIHEHRLKDTASFCREIVRRCSGHEDQPFTLAIAGYGTGKSHLALTLATLLSQPTGEVAASVLTGIRASDSGIGTEIQTILKEQRKPYLVVALNGMQNFDLTAEFIRQVVTQIRTHDLDTNPLDDLRPRFRQAANLVDLASDAILNDLLEVCDAPNVNTLLTSLKGQEEHVYARVHEFFAARGMPISALGGESIKDVIEVIAREYVGEDKPFSRLLILFDEFGRYIEFATMRSQIAGSGVLQDLFEAVQSFSDHACFVGFIQFELNAYVQRIAPEFKNEILRYITRYQSASKAYLSTNLETLIASLIEKLEPAALNTWFDSNHSREESERERGVLNRFFPQSCNYRLWTDPEQFHTVIRKGCWPLSPFSSWFLFFLTAAGKHLQERSALTLLGDVLERNSGHEIPEDGNWALAPADLWSEALEQELISSEETGQQGAITHAYSSVIAQHGAQLSEVAVVVLRAVVLASKMGMQVDDREQAIEGIAVFTGSALDDIYEAVRSLQEEYNILEWDDSFKSFDIIGDAVPRTQFLSFLRQTVASTYDEDGKAQLFSRKGSEWCERLTDIECDFAEKNDITTREWMYQGVTSNLGLLDTHLRFAVEGWKKAVAVDEARGTIIYCYTEQSRDAQAVLVDVKKLIRNICSQAGISTFPVLVVMLHDEEGEVGQALAELTIIEESLTETDKAKFGNLVGAHKEKLTQTIQSQIDKMLRQRLYATPLKEELESTRLSRVGTELFERIYKKPMEFPFDGFSTTRGNAADSCQRFTAELMQGTLDFQSVQSKPAKDKNRAVSLLKNSWDVFTKTGTISRKPVHPVVRSVIERWDRALKSIDDKLILGNAIREACFPPYGANIASAGLLLGVFVSSRIEDLAVIINDEQYAIKQWVQDGIFKGKFVDISRMEEAEIVSIGEASSEWEELLEEWDQAGNHIERVENLKKAIELQAHVSIPPAVIFRFDLLKEQSRASAEALVQLQNTRADALEKIYNERQDIGQISWGGSSLASLKKRMVTEQERWTARQITDLELPIETAIQTIIQVFPEWLAKQAPNSEAPDVVGSFKHRMLNLVGRNLRDLGLVAQCEQLEEHTMGIVKNLENTVAARQLLRDVRSWLAQHADVLRVIRIAEIRGLSEIGRDFSTKLQGMHTKTGLEEIATVRLELVDFLGNLKKEESEVKRRAEKFWVNKTPAGEDLEPFLEEVEDLIRAYEGCQQDLEDFRLIRRVLQTYQRDYHQMQNERLTEEEFRSLADTYRGEAKSMYGDEEIPWDIDETFGGFKESILKQRKKNSSEWIKAVEEETENVDNMTTELADLLHQKVNRPPAILVDQHRKRLEKVNKQIERRLDTLALEWLIAKFSELPKSTQKRFMDHAIQIIR
jgi:hypothetical protein